MTYLFLPIFHVAARRYRGRFRLIPWNGFHRVTDRFAQGTVHRLWIGWILLCIMVDRDEYNAVD